jgi:hypothetical protein
MNFNDIPRPTYDYEIKTLMGYYESALRDIEAELMRIDLTAVQRAHILGVQKEIATIISELDDNAAAWVAANIPTAVGDGVLRSILALGVVETIEEARNIVKFSRLNRELVKAAVADTQADLLQVTQNVSRKIRATIRQTTAEVMRTNLTQGVNATATLKRDILRDLRGKLGDSLNTGIIDAAGRRWKPQTYVEMVVRTKMAQAQREAAVNDGLSRGALYGVISAHGAKDMCRVWENRVISLSPGGTDYPYIGDLPRRDIFHPNCRHLVSPVRNPEEYEK